MESKHLISIQKKNTIGVYGSSDQPFIAGGLVPSIKISNSSPQEMLVAQQVLCVLLKVHVVSVVAKCGVHGFPCRVLKLMCERQKEGC